MSLNRALTVFVGGGLGTCLRYVVQHHMQWKAEPVFPWGTLTVNLSGAFLIGLILAAFSQHFEATPEWRLFLVVGILGGFTTFSSLTWEAYELISTGHLGPAALYLVLTAGGGALAVVGGVWVGQLI